MTKLILISLIAISTFTSVLAKETCDASSINYTIGNEFCTYLNSKAMTKDYDSRSVFFDYFSHRLDKENVQIDSYTPDDEDPNYFMVIKDSNKSIHIRYSLSSNDANFDIDQHSICVVKSCSIIKKD